MDTELKARIETYVQERAETLKITIDRIEWSKEVRRPPEPSAQSAPPLYTLRVIIDGTSHADVYRGGVRRC